MAYRYELTCQTTGSRPFPKVTWWKNGHLLKHSQETVKRKAFKEEEEEKRRRHLLRDYKQLILYAALGGFTQSKGAVDGSGSAEPYATVEHYTAALGRP